MKGTQPTKIPAIRVAHVEEEGSEGDIGAESKDPDGIDGMTEEFILHLVKAVKEIQKGKKCFYHCSDT